MRSQFTIRLVLSILLLATTSAVVAADKIEGAFGLKLGDVFEPTTPPITATPDGAPFSLNGAYEFTPKERNRDFSDYFVLITPNSHLVCRILAVHKAPGIENSKAFHDCLTAILHLKYQGTYDEKSGDSYIAQGKRNIGVTSPTGVDHVWWVAVLYTDDELAQRVGTEKLQNRVKATLESAKSLDATGL